MSDSTVTNLLKNCGKNDHADYIVSINAETSSGKNSQKLFVDGHRRKYDVDHELPKYLWIGTMCNEPTIPELPSAMLIPVHENDIASKSLRQLLLEKKLLLITDGAKQYINALVIKLFGTTLKSGNSSKSTESEAV